MLEKAQVRNILKTIYENFNIDKMAEITLECNPESITDDKMEGYSKSGINRISIGVQSLNNDILKIVGRIHDREEVFKKFKIVEKYFNNISVDMMFGLPNQTVEILRNNLEEVVNTFGKNGSGFERINLAAPTWVIKEALDRLYSALKEVFPEVCK